MAQYVRKFRAVVASAYEPEDKEVIWVRNNKMLFYDYGEWKPLDSATVDLTQYYTKTEVQNLLLLKQALLESGINIKTINNQSILGDGNLEVKTSDISDASDVSCNIEIEEAVATDVDEALKGIVAYAHKIKTEGTDTEPKTYVKSVNGQSGDVTVPQITRYVESFNGQTGNVSVAVPTVLTREEYTQIVPAQGVLYIIKER